VSAAHQHPDLHELVDQLNPAQADAVHAVIVQLVTGGHAESGVEQPQPPRRLSFAGTLSAEPDLAERSEEILDEIVTRNAG
jgi:hypothetical protein